MMNGNITEEERYFNAAKEYYTLITQYDAQNESGLGSLADIRERVEIKTQVLEKYGLDVSFDRPVLTVLALGVKHGATDLESAVNLGHASRAESIERGDRRVMKNG